MPKETDEVFPHAYSFEKGFMHPGDAPGLGVDINEELAGEVSLPAGISSHQPQTRRNHAQLVARAHMNNRLAMYCAVLLVLIAFCPADGLKPATKRGSATRPDRRRSFAIRLITRSRHGTRRLSATCISAVGTGSRHRGNVAPPDYTLAPVFRKGQPLFLALWRI